MYENSTEEEYTCSFSVLVNILASIVQCELVRCHDAEQIQSSLSRALHSMTTISNTAEVRRDHCRTVWKITVINKQSRSRNVMSSTFPTEFLSIAFFTALVRDVIISFFFIPRVFFNASRSCKSLYDVNNNGMIMNVYWKK